MVYMMIRSINKSFREDNLPIELVKGDGYYYYVYSLRDVFETLSVYAARLNQNTKDEWIRMGREFVLEVEHSKGIYR